MDMALKFLFHYAHYHPFCKLAVLNKWENTDLPLSINLLIFELLYGHVISLIFFKTTIPDQMKHPASS
jgi:hypothetical protein